MARLILVHGAFCSASIWGSRVVLELERAGHDVEVIDLPSHGRDTTDKADVTLDLYVQRLVDQIALKPEPPVLVGHSMAGLVITQAAENVTAAGGSVAGLLYVAAVLPRNGRSQNDYTTLPEAEGDALAEALDVSASSPKIASVKYGMGAPALFGDLDADTAAMLEDGLELQTVSVFFTPISIQDDRPIPRGYILCTRDLAIPTRLQRRMVGETPGVRVVEIDSDHTPFWSHPDEFLAAVDSLLRKF